MTAAHIIPKADSAVDAVASAWASMDGELEAYEAGRHATSFEQEPGGHFSGYQADAEEMIRRIEARGYKIEPRC